MHNSGYYLGVLGAPFALDKKSSLVGSWVPSYSYTSAESTENT